MHWQRCEPRRNYKETSLLIRANNFFSYIRYFGHLHRLKSNSFVYKSCR